MIGQIVSGVMVIVYFGRFRKMELKKRCSRQRPSPENDPVIGNGFLYQSDYHGCGTDYNE